MGMFDYIQCEVPLPDGFSGELQTKDFECPYLDTYTITKTGRLTQRYVERREPVPESEWKYVGSTDALHKLWHEQSKSKPIFAERDMNFHGVVNFYARSADRWHEYNAKFTDGQLVGIAQVHDAGETVP